MFVCLHFRQAYHIGPFLINYQTYNQQNPVFFFNIDSNNVISFYDLDLYFKAKWLIFLP